MGVYEETLEDIEKTFGAVPEFMRLFPREVLIHDWPSWKNLSEIDLERARYLLSGDNAAEEMLSLTDEGTMDYIRLSRKARTVCCGMLIDTDKALMARTMTGEEFLVCNDDCRRFVEMASPEGIKKISALRLQ